MLFKNRYRCYSGHDGSMCNADQCGSMRDQIFCIDRKGCSRKINANQGFILIDQYWLSLIFIDLYWETLVSMLNIWSHIDPHWSALQIDPSCPGYSIAGFHCIHVVEFYILLCHDFKTFFIHLLPIFYHMNYCPVIAGVLYSTDRDVNLWNIWVVEY